MLVLIAALMVVLLGMVAFAVDLGYIATIDTELQRTVDAGALAGAGVLIDGSEAAIEEVMEFVEMNKVGNADFNFAPEGYEPGIGETVDEIEIETGHWDAEALSFTPSTVLPSAVRVAVTRSHQPLFFGRVFGREDFTVTAETIATYQPRDIALVLDCSGSMNDDSEFRNISSIGQANVEANLLQIYQELGSPAYGNLQWNPVYISSNDDSYVLNQLGLNGVSYPFPSGSWGDFINYVQGSGYVNSAGYKKKYGYLTWMNYLLERKPKANQTPDLWMTSEQPISQVKDAVTIFLDYLEEAEADDQVALSIYTASDGTALLETELTQNFDLVDTISQQRQAAHYDVYTNIGDGIAVGLDELVNNGRTGAYKMIVLMTDGIANRPYDTSYAKTYALDKAQLAANENIPIFTISLGANADTQLMQQIADLTDGPHFNVPGGSGVLQYEEQLLETFQAIAADRPLKLVD